MRRILLILLVAYITGCNTKETFVVKGDLAGCLSSYQEGSAISNISLKHIENDRATGNPISADFRREWRRGEDIRDFHYSGSHHYIS